MFDQTGNRDNKLRARMKWLVDTLGFDELKRRVLATRKMLPASSTWPGGIPDVVEQLGDRPAGVAAGVTPTVMGQGTPVTLTRTRSAGSLGSGQRRARHRERPGLGVRVRGPRRHHR